MSRAYWNLDKFLLSRTRGFLMRRHKLPGRGTRRFTAAQVFERDGLFHLGAAHRAAAVPAFDSTHHRLVDDEGSVEAQGRASFVARGCCDLG